jgi:hypothetical protein
MLLMGLAAACEDRATADIRTWTRYWVERQLDTVSADSTISPDSSRSSALDSAWIDSLSSAWTADEWLRFWEEVEKEQALRRGDTAAVATP